MITEDVLKNLNENLENKELKVKYAVPKQYAITDRKNLGSFHLAQYLRDAINRQLVDKKKQEGSILTDLQNVMSDGNIREVGRIVSLLGRTRYHIAFLEKAEQIKDNNRLISFLYSQNGKLLDDVFDYFTYGKIKESCEKSVEIGDEILYTPTKKEDENRSATKIVAESAMIDINSATFTANITQMTEKVGYKRSLFGISTGTIALLAVIAFFAVTNPISAVIIASAVSSLLVLALASYATYRSAQHCHKNYFITKILPKLSNCRTANSIRCDNTTAVTTVPLDQIEATEQQTQTRRHGR